MNAGNSNKKLAAFIITFERPQILKETIDKILAQSLPPDKILIVDNSLNDVTAQLIKDLNRDCVSYHKVGFNAGPAGGANIGIKLLAEQGYEWIYWGDDDDPPADQRVFEKLLTKFSHEQNVGMIGCVGHYFNKKKGEIVRVKNEELKPGSFLEVDVIAGNMNIMINGSIVDETILPNASLFFSHEDLDCCLKIRSKGHRILVDTDSFYELRKKTNNLGYYGKKNEQIKSHKLWRRYYSVRNVMVILYTQKMYRALGYNFLKFGGKSLLNFRYGAKYGFICMYYEWRGVFDFLIGRRGFSVKPLKKY